LFQWVFMDYYYTVLKKFVEVSLCVFVRGTAADTTFRAEADER
jgi:hypothetical protein